MFHNLQQILCQPWSYLFCNNINIFFLQILVWAWQKVKIYFFCYYLFYTLVNQRIKLIPTWHPSQDFFEVCRRLLCTWQSVLTFYSEYNGNSLFPTGMCSVAFGCLGCSRNPAGDCLWIVSAGNLVNAVGF